MSGDDTAPALWQRGRVTLVWPEGHELHGLQVVMRRRPFGEVLDEWIEEDPRPWDELDPKERIARTRENAGALASLVLSWNLADDDGNPVPVGVDGLLAACDDVMIGAMREAYTSATSRVSPPLPKNSVDGPEGWDPGADQAPVL